MKIAYLAPEIPALSATFVYNEILEMEKNGMTIVPISVHVPGEKVLEEPARRLSERTCCLYALPRHVLMKNAMAMLFGHPVKFLRTLVTAFGDALSVGLLSHTGTGILFRFFAASTVARLLIREGCTHIHAHFAHIPADIAMYASMLSGVPFSFTAHANDIFVRGWVLGEKVRRSAFSIAVSGYNRDYLACRGAFRDKIRVVHCGVDSGSFMQRAPMKIHQPLRLGSLGRMVEKKGFDTLIDACRLLKDSGTPFTLELAGEGPLKRELLIHADTSGLSGEIRFIGPLTHDKVHDWLKGLDLFVLPCRKDRDGDMDGIPVVLMEAMVSGVPVLSTRLTGIPELIEDGRTGFLTDPGDPHGLASAIEAFVHDGQHRESMIRNAVDRVQADFDLSKNVRILADLFRGALS